MTRFTAKLQIIHVAQTDVTPDDFRQVQKKKSFTFTFAVETVWVCCSPLRRPSRCVKRREKKMNDRKINNERTNFLLTPFKIKLSNFFLPRAESPPRFKGLKPCHEWKCSEEMYLVHRTCRPSERGAQRPM